MSGLSNFGLRGGLAIVLISICVPPALARTPNECAVTFQKNRDQIALSGESKRSFMARCLATPPNANLESVPSEGTLLPAPNRPTGIPNTVGGVSTMPR
jgi:hypothetical protein